MNILLFALGSHGDVHPFVGIGIRLKQRGHHVAVAANGYFKPLIDHAGLEFLPLGTADEYRDLATNPDLWHPTRGPRSVFEGTAKYLRPMYDLAVDFARRPDVVMAASSLALGARVAQEKIGFPLASVHLSPSIFQSIHAPPKLIGMRWIPRAAPPLVWKFVWFSVNRIIDRLIGPKLNALRNDVGLPPVKNIIRDYWHSPDRVIGMFPEWFARPQVDWPPQTVLTGFPLFDEPDLSPISDELESFLRAGEPPIAFTPGSAMWQAHDFFQTSAAACAKLNRRGLLLTRHTDHLPKSLPPGVIHVHYAPFSVLLPRCCAFVHHAGIGTTAQAMASGVPQLCTPFTHDQPDNTARLVNLGIAKTLSPKQYTPDRAARALKELIQSQQIKTNCRQIASRFAGVDALAQTCDLIESIEHKEKSQPQMNTDTHR